LRLDVDAALALVIPFDVGEVLALALPELAQTIDEQPRLRDRAERVIGAVEDEELRADLIRELDGAAVAPQRAVGLGVAHLGAQEVTEVLLRLRPHRVEIRDAVRRDRGLPEVRLLRRGDERHEAAVAPAHDPDALAVDLRQRAQVAHGALDVLEIDATPILERGVTMRDAVAGAAANVGLDDEEASIDQRLRELVERARPLARRSTVRLHHRRTPLTWYDVARHVEERGDLRAVRRGIPDVLSFDESIGVDRAVLGRDERLRLSAREVVQEESHACRARVVRVGDAILVDPIR